MKRSTTYRENYAKRIEMWRELVTECGNSGLTVEEWFKQNGFNRRNYPIWKRKIEEFDNGEWDKRHKTASATAPTTPQITIKYGDLELCFYKDVDPQLLSTTVLSVVANVTANSDI